MAEIKATSFRVSEEDIAKFKEFAEEQGYNQAEAFKSIMQTVEMAKAKNMIKDRGKEIETFQDTINRLMSMFINSLEVNQTSEERIREELSKDLQTKENTIGYLHEELQNLKSRCSELESRYKDSTDALNIITEKNDDLLEDIKDKQKNIDKLNSNNDLLQEQLQEYKEYKVNYKKLEQQISELESKNSSLQKDIDIKNNSIDQLKGEIENNQKIQEFYKNALEDKNKTIAEYKSDMKALENKYNKSISEIKEEHNQYIATLKIENEKSLEEKLSNSINRYEIEISKKDLEIDKLKAEIIKLNGQKKAK